MTIKTDTKYPQNLFSSIILYISLLAFIQFVVAAIFTLSIIPDQKNGVLVGFSIQRLALVFISLIVASVFLVVGMVAQKRNVTYDSLSTIFKNRTVRILLKCISILLVIWGGFSFYCPPTLLREWVWGAYFERIQPFSDALGLTILEYWSFLLINHLKLSYSDQFYKIKSEFLRPILISSLPVLGIGALIAYTKIGLVEQTAYWNVAGIPISAFQFLLIVLFIVLSYFIFLKNQFLFDLLSKTNTPWIIAIAIYIIAVVVWGNEPMLRHFF
jgi:hypothetical protein